MHFPDLISLNSIANVLMDNRLAQTISQLSMEGYVQSSVKHIAPISIPLAKYKMTSKRHMNRTNGYTLLEKITPESTPYIL